MSATTGNLEQEVIEQHAQIGAAASAKKLNSSTFQRNNHPDAQWFPLAGLGLFIHWGISSVRGEGDISWSMMKHSTSRRHDTASRYGVYAVQTNPTPARYWEQAAGLKADKFDPEKILSAARNAGFKYAVLTTRHHDGFALWPSRFGDFNIGRYLPGRDLVREYVEACRKVGLKVGFYFSPPDWYFNRDHMSFNYGNQKPDLDIHHRPCTLPVLSEQEQKRHDAAFRTYLRGQIEELLTNYGTIDLFWFDGHGSDAISIERIRELQPAIVINPRAHGVGDFDTSECQFPKVRYPGWWEYCHLFSDGAWAYLNHEVYKPTGWLLAELAKARSWNGNFLPNVAPDCHGVMPEAYYKRMEQLAAWMKRGAETVFDVEPGPWPERANVPVTIRGNTWYLHLDLTHDGNIVLREVPEPVIVTLHQTGENLPFTYRDGTVEIVVPETQRTTLDDVIAVHFKS